MKLLPRLTRLGLPLAILVASLPVAVSPAVAQDDIGAGKIDPPLLEVLEAGGSARVIVLGRTQLFEPVGGLVEFQKEHAGEDRLALRREVVATLKRNAGGELLSSAPQASTGPMLVIPPDEPPSFAVDDKRVAWNVQHLNAPRAWSELSSLGQGAVVAVLDNGANYAHTDLRSNLWRNAGEIPNNEVDDDRNGWVDDLYGYDFGAMSPNVRDTSGPRQHGTMTSGMVVGDGSGGTITGVAPRAQLMLLKITGGNVDAAGNRPIGAAIAYQYAIEEGADILSMSFSLPGLGNLRGFWRMMSDHAVAAGLFPVGGAGNFRTNQPIPVQHQSPKDVPSVMSVGGIDTLGVLRPFSSMGPAEWSSVALYGDYPLPGGIHKPDVVAFPGEGFPVLGLEDRGYIDTDTLRIRGNSFSGPQVAGIAALIFAEHPGMSVWRVREIIERTAHDLGEPGKDNMFGYGLVDAYAAVLEARKEGGGGR